MIEENLKIYDEFRINNLKVYDYTIFLADNCEVLIIGKCNRTIFVPKKSLFIIEKNTSIDVVVRRVGNGHLYDFIHLSNEIIKSLQKIYDINFGFNFNVLSKKRMLDDKIFLINTDGVELGIFKVLNNNESCKLNNIYGVAYLFSKVKNLDLIKYSLSINAVATFTERVRVIIEGDVGRKWRISDVAEILHLSEISIRKKLELEGNAFNVLLLDVRMNAAFKYLIYENEYIEKIASKIAFSSTSYFIKVFKEYYGITPKQLLVSFRGNMYF